MYRVTIRFYEELNDFLPSASRKKEIDFEFRGRRSVKDLIESFGVPHVEVDLILVNGESVGRDGIRALVMKPFSAREISKHVRAALEPPD